jgi:hypothetical protein
MNTKAKQNMAYGKKDGIWKEPNGEYSTISGDNNVCNNSKEIKDFIKRVLILWPLENSDPKNQKLVKSPAAKNHDHGEFATISNTTTELCS